MTQESNADEAESVYEDYDKSNLAGDWQQEQMRDTDRINIGCYYDDPIHGARKIAGFPKQSLCKHAALSGVTGYGKSVTLRNIQYQLIEDGHGLCFISPTAHDSRELLKRIPSERLADVVWMQPGSGRGKMVGLNMFETQAEPGGKRYEAEVVSTADGFRSLLRDVTDDWNPRLDTMTDVLIQQLIRVDKSYTPVDMLRMLTDEDELDAFISDRGADARDTLRESVDNVTQADRALLIAQLQNWVNNETTRRMIAEDEPEITLGEVVQQGKILIVDTSTVRSKSAETIVTQAVVFRLWSAIQTRSEIPQSEREPFYLCIDELHKLIDTHFQINDIIALARNLKLGVLCSFQQIGQLPPHVQTTVKQPNIQISLCTGNGTDDATSIAELHRVGTVRMTQLSPYEAMCTPIAESGQSEESVAVTLFAERPPLRDSIEPIIERSLDTYGTTGKVRGGMGEYGVKPE